MRICFTLAILSILLPGAALLILPDGAIWHPGMVGGIQTDTRMHYTDTPSLLITSPVNNTCVNTSTITVTWELAHNTTRIERYEIGLDDGEPIHLEGNTTSYRISANDGEHRIWLASFDENGYSNSTWIKVIVDTTAPDLEIVSPPSMSYLNSSSILIGWRGGDELIGLDRYEVKEGILGNWISLGLNTSIWLDGFAEGENTVTVRAVDLAGNVKESSITFIVDTLSPRIEITSPYPGIVIDSDAVEILWTMDGSERGIMEIRLLVNGEEIDIEPKARHHNLNLRMEGSYDIGITAIDMAGNRGNDSVDFKVDWLAPIPNFILPVSGSYLNFSTVTFRWGFSDMGSGVKEHEIRLDGEPWEIVGGNQNRTYEGISEGTHTFEVIATDWAMRRKLVSVVIYVDTIAPMVIEYAPKGVQVDLGESILVRLSESLYAPSLIFNFSCVKGTFEELGSTLRFRPTGHLEYNTTYEVTVGGSDTAGNRMELHRWTFRTTNTGTARGRIVDENGDPIDGAVVTVDGRYSSWADDAGVYMIYGESGVHRLTITADGYGTREVNVSFEAGKDKEMGTIKLDGSRREKIVDPQYPYLTYSLKILFIALIIACFVILVFIFSRGGGKAVNVRVFEE